MSSSPTADAQRFSRSIEDGTLARLKDVGAPIDQVARAALMMERCLRGDGKLLLFGNGGSAADAQHVAAEFVGRFALDRRGLPAIALTTDTSALTAIGNDFGYERVFARQLEALGRPGDLAIAISTSGSSPNVLAAVEAARRRGVATVGLSGGKGGRLADMVDVALVLPGADTQRVQEAHLVVEHALCESVEMLLQEEVPCAGSAAKVVSWDELMALREGWREDRRATVWTNGCFDILHMGHVQSLEAARRLGDVLVVGVNSDASVRKLKGPGRPIVPAEERAGLVAALSAVDAVTIFDDPTPSAVLAALRPEVHCKGSDYAPPGGKDMPERETVESYGGRIAFLPLVPGRSSTDLLRRGAEGPVDGEG